MNNLLINNFELKEKIDFIENQKEDEDNKIINQNRMLMDENNKINLPLYIEENKKTLESSKLAVLTCVLNEHSYLHHFIYYYQYLGFDHIYILKDKGQSDLNINESLFSIKITILPVIYPEGMDNFNKVQYWNTTFMIKNIIKEDWVFCCDIDEFLYIHGKKIRDFMSYYKNLNKIGQIQFPWMIVEHIGLPTNNLFDTLNQNSWHVNDEVKAMVRRDAFITALNNHQNVIHPKYFNHHHNIMTHVNKKRYRAYKQKEYYYKGGGFVIHFNSRGLNNILIKILSYKYKDKAGFMERKKLINGINFERYQLVRRNYKFRLVRQHQNYGVLKKWKLILPEFQNEFKINYQIEENILLKLLKKNNINIQKYNKFLSVVSQFPAILI